MATYTNTTAVSGTSASLDAALGAPASLDPADIIILSRPGDNYTAQLDELPDVHIAEFRMYKGFVGNLGNERAPVRVSAAVMVLEGSGKSWAITATTSGTVGRMRIAGQRNPNVWLYGYTITALDVSAPCQLNILAGCTPADINLTSGVRMSVEAGTALTSLTISGDQSEAVLDRDVGTLKVEGNSKAICNPDAATVPTPSSVDVSAGGYASLCEGSVAIRVGHGATIDLSRATGDLTITWTIDGDFTLIEPPEGVSWTVPVTADFNAGTMTRKAA